MFTGLIEAVCTVKSASRTGPEAMQLTVDLGELAKEAKIGDSIAINGTCLTVTKLTGRLATFDISGETLAKSTIAKCKPAAQVNVEQALKASDRFAGHFVQGHIDGTAVIKTITRTGRFADIKFSADPKLLEQMVVKGSVAVDGISLTISKLDHTTFSVAVIPQTLEKTTLAKAKPGDHINIETDIIVKTIKKQLENILPTDQKLTVEKLKRSGF